MKKLLYSPGFGVILIALAALLPRVIGLRDFLTTDEAYHWITRTERFAAAIGAGRWADTILTGHPGVSLMWLGSFGQRLEEWAILSGMAAPTDRLGYLAWLRLGPVFAHTLLISGGYLLLRRLFAPPIALVAALLWATSPFLVAHGRLLHLDALLTNFATLVLLTALITPRAAHPLPWLIGSGALMGLTLLTKGPALIMLPFVGLLWFTLAAFGRRRTTDDQRPYPEPGEAGRRPPAGAGAMRFLQRFGAGLRWSVPRYLLWLSIALLVTFALWPALWTAPEAAIGRYLSEVIDNGGRPNGDGQFFLGRADADPGPLFYPAVGLFRLTPLELTGLIGAALAAGVVLARRIPWNTQHSTLIVLGAFVLWWMLVMTSGPKKFDRYILPAWPALLFISAAGLAWLAGLMRRPQALNLGLPILVLALQGGVLAWYHPYHLSYYNPLLGGGPVAQRTFLIGWGEGMDQAGAYLSARPDAGGGQILSALPPTLQPFVSVPVQEVRAIDSVPANYAVVYLESLQRGDAPGIYTRLQDSLPLHVVRIHGIEYAWVHQLARPFETPYEAEFGPGLRLRGYTLQESQNRLIFTPSWDVRADLAADLMIFLHVYDASGARVAQIDVPPGGASLPPTSLWQPGEQVGVPLPIDVPADLPAGVYTLALGMYDMQSGVRLPLISGPIADPALAGDHALFIPFRPTR
jgi:hypothetical protein